MTNSEWLSRAAAAAQAVLDEYPDIEIPYFLTKDWQATPKRQIGTVFVPDLTRSKKW